VILAALLILSLSATGILSLALKASGLIGVPWPVAAIPLLLMVCFFVAFVAICVRRPFRGSC
jgi:hypothetical protein